MMTQIEQLMTTLYTDHRGVLLDFVSRYLILDPPRHS